MRKIIFKLGSLMCCMAVFVAQMSANNICIWKAYQPKVPNSLLED